MKLTRKEVMIMRVFWAANRPLSVKDITILNSDTSLKTATLHSLLNNLLEKEAITESCIKKEGRSIARLFEAKYTSSEYITELLQPVINFIDFKKLLLHLIERDQTR